VELALEELRRAAEPPERVPDLVREVADELPVGLLLRKQPLLARLAQLLLDGPQLREQREADRVDAGHRAGDRHRLAPSQMRDVLRRVVPVRRPRLVQRALERLPLDEEAEERLPDQASRAGGEEAFGGRVGIADD